ncbi:ABC transporter ATP-binding protein [Lysinibacillus sp. NPDC097287]|uniref:ABC transporter ATP-binding protein n=1 Tax=Lysinibacillus sp. NPDC097287 TaxID=3364144 RepID=UPI0038129F48
MLKVTNLKKIYKGSSKGIQNLSIDVNPGDICAFIGSNGAGKTTTLKSIVGIHSYDSGEITLNNVDLKNNPKKFKEMIGYSPDNPDIYENMRGYEYLEFIGSIFGVSSGEFVNQMERLVKELSMEEALNRLISSYSHGMKQRLVLISIFLHNPDLIILDEPFVGLDPNASFFLTNELQRRAKSGAMIIYSTHVLEVAEKICNRVVLIDQGEVKINGLMKDLVKNESLGEIFRRVTARD